MLLHFPICIGDQIHEINCVFILVLKERYCISEITYSWIFAWKNLYFRNQSYYFSFARILAIQTVLLSRRIYPQESNALFQGFLYLCICAQEKIGYWLQCPIPQSEKSVRRDLLKRHYKYIQCCQDLYYKYI